MSALNLHNSATASPLRVSIRPQKLRRIIVARSFFSGVGYRGQHGTTRLQRHSLPFPWRPTSTPKIVLLIRRRQRPLPATFVDSTTKKITADLWSISAETSNSLRPSFSLADYYVRIGVVRARFARRRRYRVKHSFLRRNFALVTTGHR